PVAWAACFRVQSRALRRSRSRCARALCLVLRMAAPSGMRAAFAQPVARLVRPVRQLHGGRAQRAAVPVQPERRELAIALAVAADAFGDDPSADGRGVHAVSAEGGAIPYPRAQLADLRHQVTG